MTAFLYVPVWGAKALFSFRGDSVVVLYLLTIPTLCFFLGGWFSTSLYAAIGSVRTLTRCSPTRCRCSWPSWRRRCWPAAGRSRA